MARGSTDDGRGHRDKRELHANAVSVGDGHTVIIFDPENSAAWVQSDYSVELPGGDE